MRVSLSLPILHAHITELTKENMTNINGNRSAIEGTIVLKSKTSTFGHIMAPSSSPTYITYIYLQYNHITASILLLLSSATAQLPTDLLNSY